jgi:hypothetical protein
VAQQRLDGREAASVHHRLRLKCNGGGEEGWCSEGSF